MINAKQTDDILTGKVRIARLPRLHQIDQLSHSKLLLALRMCPESHLFGFSEDEISKRRFPLKKARQKVRAMVVASTKKS